MGFAGGSPTASAARRSGTRSSGSLAGGLSRLRPDAGYRIPGQQAPDSHRPRSATEVDAGGEAVAGPQAPGERSAHLAAAAEFAGRAGAVGHFPPRLA